MKISLRKEYKSLKPFESEDLNDFTIITGKNGSGKSQLINCITEKARNTQEIVIFDTPSNLNLTLIQTEGIIQRNLPQIGHEQWSQIVSSYEQAYWKMHENIKRLLHFVYDNNLQKAAVNMPRHELLCGEEWYLDLIKKIKSIDDQRDFSLIFEDLDIEKMLLTKHVTLRNEKIFNFIKILCNTYKKTPSELDKADYYNTPIIEELIDENKLFSSRLELIFYNYAKRRDLNRQNYFFSKEDGEINDSIPDIEFVKNHIAPWTIINKIFEENSIDFYFKEISKRDFSKEISLDFKLYKKSSHIDIILDDLSSGEKIIIGLILKLFTTEYYENLTFPEVIILDEPDAHLHPEMSKLLLDILLNTFVKKYGIKVIITTHSPSTIALASEDQIYQLTNGDESALKKISKDDALKLLTGFIPTLSIDYKNHRQVFVESPTDVFYYQTLHDKHLQKCNSAYRLYFISNSAGKSNCDQVYSIVEAIRKSGNSTSFGIVDWDLKNKPENFIYVHGLDERYSIENFILDPIYLVCLLIEYNNAHKILEKINISNTYSQYELGNESDEFLQNIVEVYFTEFESKYPTYKYNSERTIVEYLNGKRLEIPKWYLEMKGHDIVEKLKAVFPALEGKYKRESELQNALTIIMSKYYPFVPLSSIKIIETIGNH